MKKQKVYFIRKDIPEEVSMKYAKLIDERDFISGMIEKYTTDWVKVQEKIIEYNRMFERLK